MILEFDGVPAWMAEMRDNVMCAPVVQTRFGSPMGNCWEACVATITGIPLEEIPDGRPEGERPPYGDVEAWLLKRGWALVYIGCEEPGLRLPCLRGVPYILGGAAPSRVLHSVVALDGKIVHNPNPEDGSQIVDARAVEWLLPVFDGVPDGLETVPEEAA